MSEKPKTGMALLEELNNEPKWLLEGEKIEVEWEQWEEKPTPRKNSKTGQEYTSRDFLIKQPDNKNPKLVNKQIMQQILQRFADEYPMSKGLTLKAYEESLKGKTVVYRRPITQ